MRVVPQNLAEHQGGHREHQLVDIELLSLTEDGSVTEMLIIPHQVECFPGAFPMFGPFQQVPVFSHCCVQSETLKVRLMCVTNHRGNELKLMSS